MYSVCRGCIRRMGAEGRCLTYNRDFHEAIGETDHRLIRVEIVREVLSPKIGLCPHGNRFCSYCRRDAGFPHGGVR